MPLPAAETPLTRWRMRAALLLLALPMLNAALESLFWSRRLWGAHTLAFLSPAWWLLLPVCALAFVPALARAADARAASWHPGPRWRALLPLLAGALAALCFWLVRERHLFWGDALPVSILVPKGQAFHPDEPLSLWLHHELYVLGRGRWTAAAAIAVASAACGGAVVTLVVRELLARTRDAASALMAAGVFALQGGMAIFHGHVENYAYVTLLLVGFLTAGLAFLAGRGSLALPLGALVLAYACHLLGALAVPAALLLAVVALGRPLGRRRSLLTIAVVAAIVLALAWLARGLYGGHSPLARVVDGALMILAQPHDMQAGVFFSRAHVADVWSHIVQMGPLSLAIVLALALVLPARAMLARDDGRFVALAAISLYGPALLVGEGNLGAARNWDLFAGPSLGVALFGVLLLLEVPPPQHRRLLFAALGASLFQAVPWMALNVDAARVAERVAALPLGHGRSTAAVGTYYLNAGALPAAETWLRRAIREEPTNPNATSGLGLALARQGRLAEAETFLARAVLLKPTVPQYRSDLALLELRAHRPEAASEQWQALLGLEPASVPAWLGLAEAMSEAGRRDSAVYVLLAARQQVPGRAELSEALADALAAWVADAAARGDVAEFARVWAGFERYCPDDPRVRAWRPRARALLAARRP